jgi:hypothetical protein
MTCVGERTLRMVLGIVVGLLGPGEIAWGADPAAALRQQKKALQKEKTLVLKQIDSQYQTLRAKLKSTKALEHLAKLEAKAEKPVVTAALPTSEQKKAAQSNYDALIKALHTKQQLTDVELDQLARYGATLKRVRAIEYDTKIKALDAQIRQVQAAQKAGAQARKNAAKRK